MSSSKRRPRPKKLARLESVRYLLGRLPYTGRQSAGTSAHPERAIVRRLHRSAKQIG